MVRHWFRKLLFDPVDVSWLVLLRIGFGTLMVWHAVSYLMEGRVERFWMAPSFHFKFAYFEWVEPWPGDGMILHFYGLAILGGFIALGFLYRISSVLFFLAFTYVFLLDQARYQNHTYLICLLSFLGIFLPAHRSFSLDSILWPSIRTPVVPAWTVTLARFQVGIPYFFGGIAKLNKDWFHGEPLREWLPRENDFPFIGGYFHEDWMVHCFGISGLLLDLLAVPLLLCKRTRIVAFAALFLFHCTNARLFTLGVFPWLMIVLTTVFLPPHHLRGVAHVLRHHRVTALFVLGAAACAAWLAVWLNEEVAFAPIFAGAIAGLTIAGSLSWGWIRGGASDCDADASATVAQSPTARGGRRRVALAIGLWVLVQCLIPLRHFAIPGNVAWTKEGQRFSWHMKLNDTDGTLVFHVVRPDDGIRTRIDPWTTLTSWQAGRMDGRPEMIHQYARHLARGARQEQDGKVEVYVEARVSLNNRPPQLLIDPRVDLAAAPVVGCFSHAPWIVPLVVGGR